MILALVTMALAEPHVGPTLAARPADESEPVRAGLSGGVTLDLAPAWLDLGLGGSLGWGGGPWAMVGPDLLVGGDGLQLVAGARGGWAGGAAARLQLGFDVPLGAWSVQPVASWRHDLSPAGLELRVHWTRPTPEPPPLPPPPPPPPEPEPEPLEVSPDGALVWLPHPVCAWVDPAELPPGLDGLQARVHADGYLPGDVELPSEVPLTLQEAPAQGVLVVVGRPGDTVQVNEQHLEADARGWAMAVMPEGLAVVTVRGAGRVVVEEVAVASGHTTWVRFAEPAQGNLLLRFGLGSAVVSASDSALLQELAENLGTLHVVLQGSASPEGDPAANERLAMRRAEAVATLLRAAGVPDERIHFLDPTEPDPYRPYDEQRAVLVDTTVEAP